MRMIQVLLGVLFAHAALLSASSSAQNVAELLGEGGRVVYDGEPVSREYRLALGGLMKVNNQWRISREQKLRGVVERKTLELPDNMTFAEAKRQLQQELAQIPSATVAFACEGLDCGSSNGWANHVFDVKTLYGLDMYQYYRVLHIQRPDATLHAVYYLVQRGSGRLYLQQDLIRTDATPAGADLLTEAAMRQQLLERGFWTVAGNASALQKLAQPELNMLINLLNNNRRWRLAIVGHNYQSVPLAEQQQRSLVHAQVIEKQLVDAGVSARRLSSYGLGSLAPAGREGDGRVELVLHTR